MSDKKNDPNEKSRLHPRNKHRGRYDFAELTESCPELAQFVKVNEYNDESIDFHDPQAVQLLNKALLQVHYGIRNWEIPEGYLCPPIPGRADYIHYIADLLYGITPETPFSEVRSKAKITCLDIGVGANCIYPMIGTSEYNWSFIGADIDQVSIESARKIVSANPDLTGKIELRLQTNSTHFFRGILQPLEFVDLTICNPPFHSSAEEANSGTLRKLSNLKQRNATKAVLNFGGRANELWCEGGEERFVREMILESKQFAGSCCWFSTLISKESNLKNAYKTLKNVTAAEVKTIPMSQGNKTSRILAWTFLTPQQRNQWMQPKK